MHPSSCIPPEWLVSPFYLPQLWDALVLSPFAATVTHSEAVTTMASSSLSQLQGILRLQANLTTDTFSAKFPDWSQVTGATFVEGMQVCGFSGEGSNIPTSVTKLTGRRQWAQPVLYASGGP